MRRRAGGERAQADVAPVVLHFSRGERVIEAGDRIDAHHLLIFQAIRSQAHPRDVSRIRLAGALLAGLLIFLCYKLVRPTVGRRPTRLDALFLATVLLGNLAISQALLVIGALVRGALLREGAVTLPAFLGGWLPSVDLWKALPYAMPVTVGTVLVRMLMGPELIGLYAIGSSVLFGLLRGEGSFAYAVFALAGSLVAARRARSITRQRQLLGVGFFVASTNVAVIVCSELLAGHLLERQTLAEIAAALVGGAAGDADAGGPVHAGPRSHLWLRGRSTAGRALQSQPAGAQGADRRGYRDLSPQHPAGRPGGGRRRGHRSQSDSRPRDCPLPRPGQGESAAGLQREPERWA